MSAEWTEICVEVNVRDLDTAVVITGMTVPYGVYIEDYSDMLEMVPEIAHIDLIDEDLLNKSKNTGIVHVYISPEENPSEAISFMTERLKAESIDHRIYTKGIAEEDWANNWKNYYHPARLGNRLVVCPTWESYSPKDCDLVIHLDPGMAFGSGTHHTTRLCCSLLEEAIEPGDRVLDMGTGSGILSIAALMLGADTATGVDIDPIATRTAIENAELNGFSNDRFTACSGDLTSDSRLYGKIDGTFNVITANIVADIIIALAPSVSVLLDENGTFIASGIILPRKNEVISALDSYGIKVEKELETDGWCALLCKK